MLNINKLVTIVIFTSLNKSNDRFFVIFTATIMKNIFKLIAQLTSRFYNNNKSKSIKINKKKT